MISGTASLRHLSPVRAGSHATCIFWPSVVLAVQNCPTCMIQFHTLITTYESNVSDIVNLGSLHHPWWHLVQIYFLAFTVKLANTTLSYNSVWYLVRNGVWLSSENWGWEERGMTARRSRSVNLPSYCPPTFPPPPLIQRNSDEFGDAYKRQRAKGRE